MTTTVFASLAFAALLRLELYAVRRATFAVQHCLSAYGLVSGHVDYQIQYAQAVDNL